MKYIYLNPIHFIIVLMKESLDYLKSIKAGKSQVSAESFFEMEHPLIEERENYKKLKQDKIEHFNY